jgi:hypothetical protein
MAEPSHAQSIRLAWDPPTQSDLSFQVERGTVPGTYTEVSRVGIGVTTYEVTGLTAGVRYYFVVRSVDAAGVRSGPSNEVSAVAPTTGGTDSGTPPPPTTSTTAIQVATEPALQSALAGLQSNTAIALAPGTYQLTRSLVITGGVKNVEVRSSTGRASDVILLGPPATTANPRPAAIVISKVTGITLAAFTIRNTPGYAVSIGADVIYPRLSKLRVLDDGEFVQATLSSTGGGVVAGLVENCSFEYVGAGRNLPVGLDIRGGRNWTVRRNRFLDAAPTDRVSFGPVILAWQGSAGMVVERNVFTNTTLEIVMGLDDRDPDQNVGGAIRNNVIVRRAGTGLRGAAISLLDSPDTFVVHNTVLLSGTSPIAIDYAHPDTRGAYIVNNLVDGRIASRDGASALTDSNITTAAASWFVAPAKSDLRLRSDTGRAAIDEGMLTPYAPTDAAGKPRPKGAGVDVGAHEYIP